MRSTFLTIVLAQLVAILFAFRHTRQSTIAGSIATGGSNQTLGDDLEVSVLFDQSENESEATDMHEHSLHSVLKATRQAGIFSSQPLENGEASDEVIGADNLLILSSHFHVCHPVWLALILVLLVVIACVAGQYCLKLETAAALADVQNEQNVASDARGGRGSPLTSDRNPEQERIQQNEVLQKVIHVLYLTVFLASTDLATTILTNNYRVDKHVDTVMLLEGLLIGSYGFGALLVYPFLDVILAHFKLSLVVSGFISILSSFAFAASLQFEHNYGAIVAQILKGVGITIKLKVVLKAFADLASPDMRAWHIISIDAIGCAGLGAGALVSGVMASLYPGWQQSASAMCMACISITYTTYIVAVLEQFNVPDPVSKAPDEKTVRRAWSTILSCQSIGFLRAFLRLAWESASIILLHEAGMGYSASALMLCVPVCLGIACPFIYQRLLAGCSAKLAMLCVLMAVALSSLFFYNTTFNLPLGARVATFLLASCVFYPANLMTSGLTKATAFNSAISDHWLLSKTGQVKVQLVTLDVIAPIVGPCTVRTLLDLVHVESLQNVCAFVVTGVAMMQVAIAAKHLPEPSKLRGRK